MKKKKSFFFKDERLSAVPLDTWYEFWRIIEGVEFRKYQQENRAGILELPELLQLELLLILIRLERLKIDWDNGAIRLDLYV